MRSSIAFGANNVALPSTISRKQDHEIAKSHIFLAHVSAPNLTNATCTRGVAPAGFKTSTFLTFSTHFCFSQKTYFWYDYPGQTQFFGFRFVCFVSEGTSAESHCALGLFSIQCFFKIFCSFFQQKIDSAKVASSRRVSHSRCHFGASAFTFSHFFDEISDGKLSILRFFAKKCDGAKLAPSRGWRFRDAILTRRREQQIPPCLRSFLIFDEKNVIAGTSKNATRI